MQSLKQDLYKINSVLSASHVPIILQDINRKAIHDEKVIACLELYLWFEL